MVRFNLALQLKISMLLSHDKSNIILIVNFFFFLKKKLKRKKEKKKPEKDKIEDPIICKIVKMKRKIQV